MHEFSFADAFRPEPACILGLPLAEYSIGHELLLLRRRNAILTLSPAEFAAMELWKQVHAIREAVWICSDTYGDREKFERPGWIMWRFRWNEWKRRRWANGLKYLMPEDYALAEADLRNYLISARPHIPATGAHAAEVLYGDEKRKSHSFGQPLVANLYNFVISLPSSDRPPCALDFPMARAIWLFFARLETEGNFRIENAEEREEQAVWDELLAEREARKSTVHSPQSTVEHQVSGNSGQVGLATQVPEELKGGNAS